MNKTWKICAAEYCSLQFRPRGRVLTHWWNLRVTEIIRTGMVPARSQASHWEAAATTVVAGCYCQTLQPEDMSFQFSQCYTEGFIRPLKENVTRIYSKWHSTPAQALSKSWSPEQEPPMENVRKSCPGDRRELLKQVAQVPGSHSPKKWGPLPCRQKC